MLLISHDTTIGEFQHWLYKNSWSYRVTVTNVIAINTMRRIVCTLILLSDCSVNNPVVLAKGFCAGLRVIECTALIPLGVIDKSAEIVGYEILSPRTSLRDDVTLYLN